MPPPTSPARAMAFWSPPTRPTGSPWGACCSLSYISSRTAAGLRAALLAACCDFCWEGPPPLAEEATAAEQGAEPEAPPASTDKPGGPTTAGVAAEEQAAPLEEAAASAFLDAEPPPPPPPRQSPLLAALAAVEDEEEEVEEQNDEEKNHPRDDDEQALLTAAAVVVDEDEELSGGVAKQTMSGRATEHHIHERGGLHAVDADGPVEGPSGQEQPMDDDVTLSAIRRLLEEVSLKQLQEVRDMKHDMKNEFRALNNKVRDLENDNRVLINKVNDLEIVVRDLSASTSGVKRRVGDIDGRSNYGASTGSTTSSHEQMATTAGDTTKLEVKRRLTESAVAGENFEQPSLCRKLLQEYSPSDVREYKLNSPSDGDSEWPATVTSIDDMLKMKLDGRLCLAKHCVCMFFASAQDSNILHGGFANLGLDVVAMKFGTTKDGNSLVTVAFRHSRDADDVLHDAEVQSRVMKEIRVLGFGSFIPSTASRVCFKNYCQDELSTEQLNILAKYYSPEDNVHVVIEYYWDGTQGRGHKVNVSTPIAFSGYFHFSTPDHAASLLHSAVEALDDRDQLCKVLWKIDDSIPFPIAFRSFGSKAGAERS
mmetsp:Transcript_145536/g.466453  ORF Transcript_145536/g.466453 Transcript_145536/m.466453 type:complete len:595 (-) Transcript_145536:281-2065(-)